MSEPSVLPDGLRSQAIGKEGPMICTCGSRKFIMMQSSEHILVGNLRGKMEIAGSASMVFWCRNCSGILEGEEIQKALDRGSVLRGLEPRLKPEKTPKGT